MSVRLVFWKLELKRALQRIPQMLAGAIVLLFLAGAIALFSSHALYGERLVGRIPVGVVLPREELLAKKAMSMIASLDSVESLCDFIYQDRDTSLEMLKRGELYAVLEIPEGLVQGIMDGTNPPVQVYFPGNAGLESRIFRELTDAGAAILSAAQAGIYAGDQLCGELGLAENVPLLEQELNRIFLSYSLPREDYFRHLQVRATGELDLVSFYGISAYVLVVLLSAIPASGYLMPFPAVLARKLRMNGVGAGTRAAARIFSLGVLFAIVSAPVLAALVLAGLLPDFGGSDGSLTDRLAAAAAIMLVCLAAAAVVAVLYQAAGSLLGGIMLLFLAVTAQHFLAGGFLPLVFLPASLQRLATVLPSRILMEGAGMAVTAVWNRAVFGRLAVLTGIAGGLTALLEVRR